MKADRIVLTLTPSGGTWQRVPVDVRLRRLLRAAGRSFGLRVVQVRTEDPGAPSPLYPKLNNLEGR